MREWYGGLRACPAPCSTPRRAALQLWDVYPAETCDTGGVAELLGAARGMCPARDCRGCAPQPAGTRFARPAVLFSCTFSAQGVRTGQPDEHVWVVCGRFK